MTSADEREEFGLRSAHSPQQHKTRSTHSDRLQGRPRRKAPHHDGPTIVVVTEVVGVVLAAGSSRRLGRPKQTLAFGGRTLLAHVVADIEASALDRVVVVLGNSATAVTFEGGRAEGTYAERARGGRGTGA